jgi:hypothetical protein
MHVAIVAPEARFTQFCRTRYNLTLWQLFVEDHDKSYTKYWEAQPRVNYTILDNGAAEGHQPSSLELMQVIRKVGHLHREVVAPDVMGSGTATINATQTFLNRHYTELAEMGIKVMAVAHGKTFEEWLECYETLGKDDRVRTIGLPKIMDQLAPLKSRAAWIMAIQDKLIQKPHHLLGCSRWVGEPFFLARRPELRGILRGMDTTYPIIAGMNGKEFTTQWIEREVLPDIAAKELTHGREKLINRNIEQLVFWGSGVTSAEAPPSSVRGVSAMATPQRNLRDTSGHSSSYSR